VRESRESVELVDGVTIEVITASNAAPRGRSYVLVVVEEAAFLQNDAERANPDVELLRAVRPALARVPGSLLVVVSSPYARKGVLWQAWQKYRDAPDGEVVLVQASTLALNPTFDRRAIEAAYADDPVAARSEYGAEFRTDVEGFLDFDALDAVVVRGRIELAPVEELTYVGFLDMAGGSAGGDSATLAIAHRDARGVAVLDLVRERRPPFSPEQVVGEFAADLARYRRPPTTADRWAGEFPVEAFRRWQIEVRPSAKPKSDLYRELLPLVNAGRVELLDVPRLRSQLLGLERRTARGGRDSIDHPQGRGRHDDVANAAAGALVLAAGRGTQGALILNYTNGLILTAAEYDKRRRAAILGLPLIENENTDPVIREMRERGQPPR
jgi:hypothetical protein